MSRQSELEGVVQGMRNSLTRCFDRRWVLEKATEQKAITAIEQLREAAELVERSEVMLDRLVCEHNIKELETQLSAKRQQLAFCDKKLAEL